MFNPKRMIPKLAVAALALTGCGETDSPGGSSGTGGTNGTLAGSLEAFCLKLVECFPVDYANAEACVSGLTTYYDLGGGVSSECEAAAISYFQCGAALTCQELDMDANSCSDEAAAADQACS